MRGFFNPPPPPPPHYGPLDGVIRGGTKYPFGCIKKDDYDNDQDELEGTIQSIGNQIGQQSLAITSLTGTVGSVTERTVASEATLGTHTAKIAGLETRTTDIESDITDTNETIASNTQRIAQLEASLEAVTAEKVKITSISVSPETAEKGASENVILTWSVSTSAVSQSINNAPVTGSTAVFPSVDQTKAYNLKVTDEYGNTDEKSATIKFLNWIYYGCTSIVNEVSSLSKVLSDDKSRTITVNCGTGQSVVYAIPKRLGKVTFTVNGFSGGFSNPSVKLISNPSGYSEEYYVYVSNNQALGEIDIVIK